MLAYCFNAEIDDAFSSEDPVQQCEGEIHPDQIREHEQGAEARGQYSLSAIGVWESMRCMRPLRSILAVLTGSP